MTEKLLERNMVFDRIGGQEVLNHLVDVFYDRMETLPEAAEIRKLHPDDLGPVRAVLKQYLAQWTGGPTDYSDQRGHPRLRRRHLGFPIGEAERDAWLFCMKGALSETISDETARDVMYDEMSNLADWLRNKGDNPHDQQRPHPQATQLTGAPQDEKEGQHCAATCNK